MKKVKMIVILMLLSGCSTPFAEYNYSARPVEVKEVSITASAPKVVKEEGKKAKIEQEDTGFKTMPISMPH